MTPPLVLVVENNPTVREFIRTVLEDAGMEVSEADSLKSTQWAILAGRADVLILDYLLPATTALEVLDWTRRTNSQLADKTIIISGALEGAARERLGQAVRGRILAKPFGGEELLAAVSELFD